MGNSALVGKDLQTLQNILCYWRTELGFCCLIFIIHSLHQYPDQNMQGSTLSLSGVQFFCIYAVLVLFWQMQRLQELFKSPSQDVIEAVFSKGNFYIATLLFSQYPWKRQLSVVSNQGINYEIRKDDEDRNLARYFGL